MRLRVAATEAILVPLFWRNALLNGGSMPEDLTNPVVRSVLSALRDADRDAFFACFAEDATFTDDGTPEDLHAWAEREVFSAHGRLRVDSADDGGLRIVGQYTSDQGDLATFWHFQLGGAGVSRLDVGAL